MNYKKYCLCNHKNDNQLDKSKIINKPVIVDIQIIINIIFFFMI